ncbi:MAG TPA: DUF4157 domain-containing protein [Ktedonobacteraceae bacterium]
MFEQSKRVQRASQNATRSVPTQSLRPTSSSTPHQATLPIPRYNYSIGTIPIFPPVQRAAIGPATDQDEQLGTCIQAAKRHGQPLDSTTQHTLEQDAGVDLTYTRIHTDPEADRLAHLVNARAFTSGTDIFFRAGMYQPSTVQGLRLLAHETTHIVQQAQGPVAGTRQPGGITLSDPGDAFEQAAERRASQFTIKPPSPAHNRTTPQTEAATSIVPQQTTSPVVVQRETMPVKESLKAPGGSTAVPDLTDAQVQKIQNATSPTDRLTVIVDIVKDLLLHHKVLDTPDADYKGAEVISGTTPHTPKLLSIRVTYYNASSSGKTALTYHDKDDKRNEQSWYKLDVYAPAFQDPSIFYSTIRHELIHVGQRVLTPENYKVDPNDKLKYEVNEQYQPTTKELKDAGYTLKSKKNPPPVKQALGQLNTQHMDELAPNTDAELEQRFLTDTDRQLYSLYVGAGTAGPGNLQEGLQEAETYTWEILHISETNIPPSYVVETMKLLLDYLKLIETIAGSLSVLQKSYWEAYVIKTAQTIKSNGSTMQTLLTSRWNGDTTVATSVTEATTIWQQIVLKANDIEQLWINALAPAKTKALSGTTTGMPTTGRAAPGTNSTGYGKFQKRKRRTRVII